MYLVNHNSYTIIALLLWLTSSAFLYKKINTPWNLLLSLGFAVVLLAVFFWLRPKQENTSELDQFKAQLSTGKFSLLEFQSPY